eukprot:IDg16705t1
MSTMKFARYEIVKNVAKNRLRTALTRKVPAAADNGISVGSCVLIYRERPKQ